MNEARTRIGEAELRMALHGLRKDIEPGHDLWPGIAARLQSQPRPSAQPASKTRHAWLWPFATAATVLLAVGVAWQIKPGKPVAAIAPVIAQDVRPATHATLVQREADSLTVQYHAAMREIAPQPVPASWQPGLDALDRSALEIRGALQRDPDSRLLLQRLRDTYTRRLALARRALYA
jgi:hypothetical protein